MTFLKKAYPYMATAFGAFMLAYAFIKTPSLADSHDKLSIMKRDQKLITKNDGSIISSKEIDKYGVADLSVILLAGSIPQVVQGQDTQILVALGWTPIGSGTSRYCKDGILYSPYLSPEEDDGRKLYVMHFRYTSQTIDICKRRRN
jgi:hypothetical protein